MRGAQTPGVPRRKSRGIYTTRRLAVALVVLLLALIVGRTCQTLVGAEQGVGAGEDVGSGAPKKAAEVNAGSDTGGSTEGSTKDASPSTAATNANSEAGNEVAPEGKTLEAKGGEGQDDGATANLADVLAESFTDKVAGLGMTNDEEGAAAVGPSTPSSDRTPENSVVLVASIGQPDDGSLAAEDQKASAGQDGTAPSSTAASAPTGASAPTAALAPTAAPAPNATPALRVAPSPRAAPAPRAVPAPRAAPAPPPPTAPDSTTAAPAGFAVTPPAPVAAAPDASLLNERVQGRAHRVADKAYRVAAQPNAPVAAAPDASLLNERVQGRAHRVADKAYRVAAQPKFGGVRVREPATIAPARAGPVAPAGLGNGATNFRDGAIGAPVRNGGAFPRVGAIHRSSSSVVNNVSVSGRTATADLPGG